MSRKIFLTIVLIAASFFNSCSLDSDPISTINTDSFWKTEDDARAALYGSYNMFRATFDIKMHVWGDMRNPIWSYGENGGFSEWDKLWNNQLVSTMPRTSWARIFIVIADCNALIKNIEGIEFGSQEEKDHIIGQAHFLRAFSYFWLAKVWGDAPIVTDPFESADGNTSVSRSSVAEVMAQAKADVAVAVAGVAEGTPGDQPYFVTKAAADMLMTDIYLWSAKVHGGGTADLEMAQDAIDRVLAAGYALEASYENVFRSENTNEVIFSIFYDETAELPEGSDETGRSRRGTNIGEGTLLLAVPEDVVSEAIPRKGNGRGSVLRLSDDYVATLPDSADDTRTDVVYQRYEDVGAGIDLKWINKYLGSGPADSREMINDMIVYRYAEALLFKAEIENALGNTATAITFLNMVAERAYGDMDHYSATLTAGETDDAILDERLLELSVEGKSYHDIWRFGEAFTRITTLVGRENDNQGNILYFPVSDNIINRNTSITQTPGY